MPTFETYVTRHGEFGVQALLEKLARYDGVRFGVDVSLEERWKILMAPAPQHKLAA